MTDFSLSKIQKNIDEHINMSDRSNFDSVLKYLFSNNKLVFSVPELYNNKKSNYYPTKIRGIVAYTFNDVKSIAESIEKDIKQKFNTLTYLKEIDIDKEYGIYVMSRYIFTLIKIPDISKNYKIQSLTTNNLKFKDIPFKNLSPELELIEVYHKMYQPVSDSEFEQSKEDESLLVESLEQKEFNVQRFEIDRLLNIDPSNPGKCKDILCVFRKYFIESLPFNENLGILCGAWAIPILISQVTGTSLKSSGSKTVDPKTIVQELEKPQIITDIPIDKFRENLANLMTQWTDTKYTVNISNIETNDLPIIGDFRLTRSTIYINISGQSLPFIDVWNNTEYELVPYVYINYLKTKIKLAHPYVLARLLLIDHWILTILSQNSEIKKIDDRLSKILMIIQYLHNSELHELFPIRKHTNYEGIWIEEKISKKMKQLIIEIKK
jgi:hypothetical protein